MGEVPVIDNRAARRVLLNLQGLSIAPHTRLGKDGLLQLIDRMGFVQLDSVKTVERAHHMILFARNQTYRQDHLKELHEGEGALFENWTHDASLIPTRFYPYWRHKFSRESEDLKQRWRKWRREGFEELLDETLGHVRRNGPLRSRDLTAQIQGQARQGDGWWDWHPHKTALEYLWRTGQLCVARREGFQKVYDVSENVIPPADHSSQCAPEDFVEWACAAALDRLGFATHGEIAAFWDLVSPAEAKLWCEEKLGRELCQVEVQSADGSAPRILYAWRGYTAMLEEAPKPPARLRALSPFDPVIRDRKRLARLFGFNYRIEIFVPEAKREYGYYVFPLLEGERFVGRADIRLDADTSVLSVRGVWMEPRWKMNAGRQRRWEAELERLRRFVGADRVSFAEGWLKSR